MRISDWSSDVCSSDLVDRGDRAERQARRPVRHAVRRKIAFMTQHVGGQFQTRLRNAVEMNRRRAIAGNVVDIEKQPADQRTNRYGAKQAARLIDLQRQTGRASWRERVGQYV